MNWTQDSLSPSVDLSVWSSRNSSSIDDSLLSWTTSPLAHSSLYFTSIWKTLEHNILIFNSCVKYLPKHRQKRSQQHHAKKVDGDHQGLAQDSKPDLFWPIRRDVVSKSNREFFALESLIRFKLHLQGNYKFSANRYRLRTWNLPG